MKAQNVEDLMYIGMTYILDFEQKISQAAGKMAEATTEPEVKEIFQKTTTQSQKYAERLQASFKKPAHAVAR